jgi:predicted dehydrogenase
MSLSRRRFLHGSMLGTLAVTVGGRTEYVVAEEPKASSSPNELISVAMVGIGGRGGDHMSHFMQAKNGTQVTHVCDVDEAHAQRAADTVEKSSGKRPLVYTDFRKALEDKSVDCVSTATPNHWHSLVAIWSMMADKDVYVEKPVSHNVWEGRQAVNWARKLGRICQCGTQSRSSPSLAEGVKYVQSGELGKILYAIGTCYKPRPSIGKLDKPLEIPGSIDYDMWCGPAAKVDLYRPKLHYDWHWDFNTGNGDMGNQGIHQMDIARWFLGEQELSPQISSIGGRLGYDDAGNTPNTQTVIHNYKNAPLIFETRGLPKSKLNYKDGMDSYRGSGVGVIVQCEKGYVVIPSYSGCTAYDPDGKEIKKWSGGGDHYGNFIKGVRSRKHEDLNADIFDGHLSSALCHTGAISHMLGKKMTAEEASGTTKVGSPHWADSFDRMATHLRANLVDIDQPVLTVGPWLEMDGKAERFTNSDEANELLTRKYRTPYIVPECPA